MITYPGEVGDSELIVAKDRIYKILSILSSCLIIYSTIILWNSPLAHYQLSPFSGVTPLVWVLLILSFGISSYILIDSQKANQTQGLGHWGTIALGLLILTCAVVALFPYIRSAWFSGRETLSHVGLVQSILMTGTIDTYYPVTHILAGSLTVVTHMSPYGAIAMMAPAFYLLSILFMYYLAKVVFKNKMIIAIATVCASVYYIGELTTVAPVPPTLMLPLFLALYLQRDKSVRHSLCCIILLFLYVFFHPAIAVFSILGLISIELFNYVVCKKTAFSTLRIHSTPKLGSPNALLFFSVGLLAWLSYEWIMTLVFPTKRLMDAFTVGVDIHPVNYLFLDFPALGITDFALVHLFLKLFGSSLVFVILTAIALFLIVKNIRSRSAEEQEYNLFILSGWIIALGVLLVIFLVTRDVFGIGFIRPLYPILMVLPIFVAFALQKIYMHLESQQALLGIAVTLFIISGVFANMIFSMHPSPHILQSNSQVMKAEIRGAEWILKYTDPSIVVVDLGGNMRYIESILPANPETSAYIKRRFKRVEHLGYDQSNSLNGYCDKPRYITLQRERTLRAIELYAPLDWLTDEDIQRLYSDTSVNKIYHNHEYSAYLRSP